MKRITKNDLPKVAKCPTVDCVYNESGICDDVYTNRGNDDADCHKKSPKKLLEELVKI